MKLLALIVVVSSLLCAAPPVQQPAATDPAKPGGQSSHDQRMVQAVQYPYEQKVRFEHLFSTGRVKDINGSAEVLRKKTIAVEVDVDAPPASQLKPEYKGYVVWALTPNGQFTNLGPVEAKGKLKTTTKLPAFGILVSAESDLKATTPTDVVLESGMPDAKKRYYPIYRVFYTPRGN